MYRTPKVNNSEKQQRYEKRKTTKVRKRSRCLAMVQHPQNSKVILPILIFLLRAHHKVV